MLDTRKSCGRACARFPEAVPIGPCHRFAQYRVFHSLGPVTARELCFRSRIKNTTGEPCCKDKITSLFSTPTMVHMCLTGRVVYGHEWCMVDWLEKALRCEHCGLKFDTEVSDAKQRAEDEERRAAEKAAQKEADEDDDTPWGLPSAKERKARAVKLMQVQTTFGDSRVVLPRGLQRETLNAVEEQNRRVALADLAKGWHDPLRYFKEDIRGVDKTSWH